MKRYLLLLASAILFVSCGVGSYTHASGIDDVGCIVLVSDSKKAAEVYVDGTKYKVNSVKKDNFASKRDANKGSENIIRVAPGQHSVVVEIGGETVYSKKVYVSNSETKVIKL